MPPRPLRVPMDVTTLRGPWQTAFVNVIFELRARMSDELHALVRERRAHGQVVHADCLEVLIEYLPTAAQVGETLLKDPGDAALDAMYRLDGERAFWPVVMARINALAVAGLRAARPDITRRLNELGAVPMWPEEGDPGAKEPA